MPSDDEGLPRADGELPRPLFDIAIGPSARDSTVRVNDVDITASIQGVTIACMANGLTRVTLFVLPGQARATVQGAIDEVLVLNGPWSPVVPPDAHSTTVFSRPNCIFQYCPSPDTCVGVCAHPAVTS